MIAEGRDLPCANLIVGKQCSGASAYLRTRCPNRTPRENANKRDEAVRSSVACQSSVTSSKMIRLCGEWPEQPSTQRLHERGGVRG